VELSDLAASVTIETTIRPPERDRLNQPDTDPGLGADIESASEWTSVDAVSESGAQPHAGAECTPRLRQAHD
jgi:hypothetical protein